MALYKPNLVVQRVWRLGDLSDPSVGHLCKSERNLITAALSATHVSSTYKTAGSTAIGRLLLAAPTPDQCIQPSRALWHKLIPILRHILWVWVAGSEWVIIHRRTRKPPQSPTPSSVETVGGQGVIDSHQLRCAPAWRKQYFVCRSCLFLEEWCCVHLSIIVGLLS